MFYYNGQLALVHFPKVTPCHCWWLLLHVFTPNGLLLAASLDKPGNPDGSRTEMQASYLVYADLLLWEWKGLPTLKKIESLKSWWMLYSAFLLLFLYFKNYMSGWKCENVYILYTCFQKSQLSIVPPPFHKGSMEVSVRKENYSVFSSLKSLTFCKEWKLYSKNISLVNCGTVYSVLI